MRSPILSIVVGAALMMLAAHAPASNDGPTLTAPDASSQARTGSLTLIDIRRPDEWRQTGVAKNALRISMDNPEGMAGFLQQLAAAVGCDKTAPIGLICRTGNRTTKMQQLLFDAGFTHVYNIKEGMVGSDAGPGWIARGLPVQPCPEC